MILMTNITVSYKTCQDYRSNLSLYAKPRCRMPPASPKRFLQSEICQGSTVPKGRCPPGALALHSRRSQGDLVLLDSHLFIYIIMYITQNIFLL